MTPELWKCNKPSSYWEGPTGHVLWLVRQDDTWMAVHAPLTCTSVAEVTQVNNKAVGSWDHIGNIRPAAAQQGRPLLESWHLRGIAGFIQQLAEPERELHP